MKTTENLKFILLPFALILLSMLVASLYTSWNHERKVASLDQIVSTFEFKDTLVQYQLYQDSIVLQWSGPSKHKHWIGGIYLVKENPREEIYVKFPNAKDGYLGKLTLTNQKHCFTGFHLPPDSVDQYRVLLEARPHFLGCTSIGQIHYPWPTFHPDTSNSSGFILNKSIKDLTMTTFDLVKIKSLPDDYRAFCLDSIESAYGRKITDKELSQSSVEW